AQMQERATQQKRMCAEREDVKKEDEADNATRLPGEVAAPGRCDEAIPVVASLTPRASELADEERLFMNGRTPLPFVWEPYPFDCTRISLYPCILATAAPQDKQSKRGIDWKDTLLQSLTFTTWMNLWRVATEPSTRRDLRGPFWKDYINSAKSVRGWRDGDEFLVNYVGHPLQGAVSGNILIQNDSVA